MTRPRHAKRRPTPWITLAVLVAVVTGLIGFGAGGAGITTVDRPVPGPTWTQPIPQTPAVCIEAMQASDNVFHAGLAADDAVTKATGKLRDADTLAEVNEAKKLNDKAKRATKAASQARRTYLNIAAKCKESI